MKLVATGTRSLAAITAQRFLRSSVRGSCAASPKPNEPEHDEWSLRQRRYLLIDFHARLARLLAPIGFVQTTLIALRAFVKDLSQTSRVIFCESKNDM